jgi:hypothetical protein
LLVLFGAQLSHALQHAATYEREADGTPAHHAARELATCRVFLAVAADFFHGRPPTDRDGLAAALGLPARLVDEVVLLLGRGGFTCETERRGLLPGRDLASITVSDLIDCVRQVGAAATPHADAAAQFLEGLLGELDAERRKRGAAVDFRTLADRFGQSFSPAAS